MRFQRLGWSRTQGLARRSVSGQDREIVDVSVSESGHPEMRLREIELRAAKSARIDRSEILRAIVIEIEIEMVSVTDCAIVIGRWSERGLG